MQSDEQQIRQLVASWMDATRRGDTDTVLTLMTDDVVFLTPGNQPMGKDEFAAAARSQDGAATIDGASDIRELAVFGDWAFMWSSLTVTVTPADSATSMIRAGHTLTLFRKENGRWRLARDANMLQVVENRPRTGDE